MTHLEQCTVNFTERMTATFYFAVAPIALLVSLFSIDGEGYSGSILRGIGILFGVLAFPVLLLAAPVMFLFGAAAAIAQIVFFPFQLFSAFLNDGEGSAKPNQDGAPNGNETSCGHDIHRCDAGKAAGAGFSLLFDTGSSCSDASNSSEATYNNELDSGKAGVHFSPLFDTSSSHSEPFQGEELASDIGNKTLVQSL